MHTAIVADTDTQNYDVPSTLSQKDSFFSFLNSIDIQ